jgi:hypothetical protein
LSFPRSWLITGFVTRLTRRVSLVEQELLTLPEHLSSPPVFSGVRVTRSLVLYVCFVDRCLSFSLFSFNHCVVCSPSICGLWLPLWYRQTLFKSGSSSSKSTSYVSEINHAQTIVHSYIIKNILNVKIFACVNKYTNIRYVSLLQLTILTNYIGKAYNARQFISYL